jgi:hypothetical protein
MRISMRTIAAIVGFGVALLASAAAAETLDEFTAKGGTLTIEGLPAFDIKFTSDGKFSALQGVLNGTYKIDGDKLCLKGDDGNETCTTYPKGKKSGDTFEVEMPQGKTSVKID